MTEMSKRACTKCGVNDAYSAKRGLCLFHGLQRYDQIERDHGPEAALAEAIRNGSGSTE